MKTPSTRRAASRVGHKKRPPCACQESLSMDGVVVLYSADAGLVAAVVRTVGRQRVVLQRFLWSRPTSHACRCAAARGSSA